MGLIQEAYRQFDEEKEVLERALEISSAELLQRNELMRAVFMALPDVFLWVTPDGLIQDCRGGLKALFGIEPVSLIKKNLADIPDIADPQTFSRAMRMLAHSPFFQAEYALHAMAGPGTMKPASPRSKKI
jgi:PAS domain-containing protein